MPKSSPFSFFDTDANKLMSEMRIPGLNIESIIASQRKNVEVLAEANQLALRGMQSVMTRQSEIMQQTMEEANILLGDLLKVSSPQEKVAQQTLLVKIAFERALTNMRELSEMLATSNTEAADVISKRVSENLDELRATVSKAAGCKAPHPTASQPTAAQEPTAS